MPIPGNVIPWFQMNGKVGQPSNNSAIQVPYRFFRIICLQECKCHCFNIMDISIWTSNNIISFHVLFLWIFFITDCQNLKCTFLVKWLKLLYLRKNVYWFKFRVFVKFIWKIFELKEELGTFNDIRNMHITMYVTGESLF